MAGRNGRRELAKRRRTGTFPLRRPAMTLIELLVVVSIAVLLLGVAIPMMKPAIKEGRIREASRQLNTYVNLAKARAAERGRTVALWIERRENQPNAAQQVFLAESPPPYGGDTTNAKATLVTGTRRIQFNALSGTLPALIKPGDVIKFDYKGHLYQIATVSPLGTPAPWVDLATVTPPLPPIVGKAVPYQIFRQPQKSILTPLQLPGNVVIDLQYSGMGRTGRQFYADPSLPPIPLARMENTPVLIAFTPGGRVDHVAYGGTPFAATGVIHLLVGTLDEVADVPNNLGVAGTMPFSATDMTVTAFSENAVDPANLWVSVGHRTGNVSSAENAWDFQPVATPNITDSLLMAREFAQAKQSMGGR